MTWVDTSRSVPYAAGAPPRPSGAPVAARPVVPRRPSRPGVRTRLALRGEPVEQRVHLRHPVAAQRDREPHAAQVLGPQRAVGGHVGVRPVVVHLARAGRPCPPPRTAMPPSASTIRIAKNHIIGTAPSRASTISRTASSTSSVSVSMSRSAAADLAVGQDGVAQPADQAAPVVDAEQHDREAGHLAGLDQRQRLEELVEGADAAGQHHEALGVLHEHRLAGEEVAEVDPAVDPLVEAGLEGQLDAEADAQAAGLAGALVGRLHRARARRR